MKEQREKVGLKLSIQKAKIVASSLIISWQKDEENSRQWQIFFSCASKPLQMVPAAMKLKDACSSEEKL